MLRLGILLILLSFLPWLALPVVPWLAEDMGTRAGLAAGLVILGELLFWPGVALAGRDAWLAARSKGWKQVLPELMKKLRAGH
jgi:hypothetical protein